MNIDFYKWAIEKAERFTLNGDQLVFPEGGCELFNEHLLGLRVWELVWEPLLFQMACEALHISFYWEPDLEGWYWGYEDAPSVMRPVKSLTEAHKAALMGVFEQKQEK